MSFALLSVNEGNDWLWSFSVTPTWINGATDDPPERIPCPVIKPVVKFIKSFFCQEAGRTVVEVAEGETRVRANGYSAKENLVQTL